MDARTRFVSAADAANRLGVRRQTLYSYVSRGLIRTKVDSADPRARLYAEPDIDALMHRRALAKRPAAAAATALNWGLPVLETVLCNIADGRLTYRNRDAVELAETATLEDVAALLWGLPVGSFTAAASLPVSKAAGATDRAIEQLASLLPDDPPAVAGTVAAPRAARLVGQVAEAAAAASLDGAPLHAALAKAWRRPVARDAIRRALVLSADHELNASSFAVRVVASTGASLCNSIIAGLAALSGPIHGGASERAAAFLDEAERAPSARAAVAARLRRGEPIPGFGHPLYPDGDPRAAALLGSTGLRKVYGDLIGAVEEATGQRPNIDFALAGLERTLNLPQGAALALFAIGRSVGWIAHAFEQQSTGQLIRPRARYIG